MSDEQPVFVPTKIEIRPLERCPTCGNFVGHDHGFLRRVELLYIVPKKSKDYSFDYETMKPYCVQERTEEMVKKFGDESLRYEDESPEGLYSAIIVPKHYTGHLLRLTPISEEQAKEDDEKEKEERKKREKDES